MDGALKLTRSCKGYGPDVNIFFKTGYIFINIDHRHLKIIQGT